VKSRLLESNPLGDPPDARAPRPRPRRARDRSGDLWFLVGSPGPRRTPRPRSPGARGSTERLRRLIGERASSRRRSSSCRTAFTGVRGLAVPEQQRHWAVRGPPLAGAAARSCGRASPAAGTGSSASPPAASAPSRRRCGTRRSWRRWSATPETWGSRSRSCRSAGPRLGAAAARRAGGVLAAFARARRSATARWIAMERAGRWPLLLAGARGASRVCSPHGAGTGALQAEVWDGWLAFDPVHLADDPANLAKSSRGCGSVSSTAAPATEYQLQWGAGADREAEGCRGCRTGTRSSTTGTGRLGIRYDVLAAVDRAGAGVNGQVAWVGAGTDRRSARGPTVGGEGRQAECSPPGRRRVVTNQAGVSRCRGTASAPRGGAARSLFAVLEGDDGPCGGAVARPGSAPGSWSRRHARRRSRCTSRSFGAPGDVAGARAAVAHTDGVRRGAVVRGGAWLSAGRFGNRA